MNLSSDILDYLGIRFWLYEDGISHYPEEKLPPAAGLPGLEHPIRIAVYEETPHYHRMILLMLFSFHANNIYLLLKCLSPTGSMGWLCFIYLF